MENWLPINGYEGLYEISDLGRVKSLDRYVYCPSRKLVRVREKILKQKITNQYHTVTLNREGVQRTVTIHILVAKQFLENPDGKRQVNHRDGNKLNNCVSNLEWCTGSENMRHAVLSGLQSTKLTPSDVRRIRSLHSQYTSYEIGDMYDVNPRTIRKILKNELWVSVD